MSVEARITDRKLDIIMPHWTEPWEVGEKFFAMLDLQRGIDFGDIRVMIVNDGEGNRIPDERFRGRPYRVDQVCIPHAGVSAARNAGIRAASAEWVMFCDFDDTFLHVYALRDILNVLPAPEYDMLWGDFYSEDVVKNLLILRPRKENLVFIHAKLYRREFLIRNGILFDEELTFNEDSEFNSVADTYGMRTGKIVTSMPLYAWCFREGSTTTTPERRYESMWGLWKRNKRLCEAFRERLGRKRYCAMVARTVWDAYHTLNQKRMPDELKPMVAEFREWYRPKQGMLDEVEPELMKKIYAISYAEHRVGAKEERDRWEIDRTKDFDGGRPLSRWLDDILRGEE